MITPGTPSYERFDGSHHEIHPDVAEYLLDFIRTQFEAAYAEEDKQRQHHVIRTDDQTLGSDESGSFYQQVPTIGEGEHELTRNSTRICMRPPFSVGHIEQPMHFV